MIPNDVGLGTDAFLRNLNARSGELRARAEQMQVELSAVLETARARNGFATVTVGAGGIMRSLVIEPASAHATPAELAGGIMTAYQQGCRLAAEKAAEIVQRHAPGSPAVDMMRAAIPPDPDPDIEDAGAGR
ncbi:MAG: YbaB/EbfC family nucleoid-associated protein [Jatrophihabitantaceae bacterium]